MLKCFKYESYKLLSRKTYLIAIIMFAVTVTALVQFQVNQNLLNDTYNESISQTDYNIYLESIKKTALEQGAISIFQSDKSTFSSKNIEKTAKDMEKMESVIITPDNDKGIILVTDNNYTNIIIIMVLILSVYFIFFREKENGLYNLIKPTPNGNTKTYSAKLLLLFFNGLILQSALFLITILFAIKYYGFGDLSRSIQSVSTFMKSDIKCSAIEMLILLFIFRVIGTFVIELVFMVIALILNNAILFTTVTSIMVVLNYILTLLNPQSIFSFFKYINLVYILDPIMVLSNYNNLNIFGYPINLKIVIICAIILIISLSAFFGLIVFKKSELVAKHIKLGNILNGFNFFSNSKCLFMYELYKTSFINKAAILLCIFIVFEIFTVINTEYYKSPQEHYYANYLEILQGELTEEKIVYIQNEKQKIEKAEKMQNILNEQYNNGEISLSQLQDGLKENSVSENRKAAFNQVMVQYEYIKSNERAHFVYDTGYKKMLNIGDNNKTFGTREFLVLITLIILCTVESVPLEYKSGMISILNATPKGTKITKKSKLSIAFIYTTVLFILTYLMQFIIIFKNYGLKGLSSPICSIQEFKNIQGISICGALMLKMFIVFGLCIVISFIPILIKRKKWNNN